ncbi:superoxide dismutase[Cu-Zn] [Mycolicibacterium sp. Dal123E01]|uniref:superoxide dismutase[Cu-Zn] n=1 Tax=Mycolicibacterium sp. Dal123E01 TaxID=3457578 RepID=UPI00403E8A31
MFNRTVSIAALFAAPVVVLTGCNSTQTGSQQTSGTTTSAGSSAQSIKAELKSADGKPVANATIDFANGYATVTVETLAGGALSPGSHGMHIHSIGKCEPDSVAPSGGPPGNFLSAGGHLQVGGRTEHPASGDLTPLNIRTDGSGKLVATTDAFTLDDLKGPEGSAVIIHAGPDNFANIPQRYTHDGVPGPDAETMATGDAGARVACAVLAPASATTSVTTSTSTVTETTAVPVPPATSPTTTSPSSSSTTATTSASPTTTTSPTTSLPTTTSPPVSSPAGG